jgi:uncharacterized Tic20 family protein
MTDTGPIPPDPSTPPSTPPGDVPPAGVPANPPVDYAAVPSTAYTGPEPTKDEKTMAMLAHLLGLLGFIGPLVIWLIKKDQSQFVDDQGKEALNFHLMLLIGLVAGGLLTFVCIGFFILPAVYILGVVFSIIGAMKANQGIAYRYPFTIHFIK